MFQIACSGGIGDGLLRLSVFPHEFLFRKFGRRCDVVFFQIALVDAEVAVPGASLVHAEFPNVDFFRGLVERCPSLRWKGQVDSTGSGVVLNRAVREVIKAANRGKPRYFPFHPELKPEEWAALPQRREGQDRLIGIQTHLSGMKTKLWGIENWKRFLELLLQTRPDLRIVLFDTAPAVESLRIADNISTTSGFHIAQSIRLIERLDLMVSIDSWSKYIAKAHRVPQIIIVPDQRPEYPELSTEILLERHFAGLYDDPDITLIGLQPETRTVTLARMSDLRPEDLVQRTLQKIDGLEMNQPSGSSKSARVGKS